MTLLGGVAMLAAVAASPAAPIPDPPAVNARGYLLVDYHSGKALAEKNADQRMEPASLTKLMTAYIVFSELKAGTIALDGQARVSEKAWRTPGSRMFVDANSRVAVADLLQGMIVQSGNDATVALAEHVAGSEDAFAGLMNDYGALLDLTATHYTNSTGLPDPEHYTTARDLATLTRALIGNFPEYYRWYSQKEFTYNNITQYNRNKLLWRDERIDGVKTGHTESAGFCLIASAKRDDMRLIALVLGTSSEEARAQESQKLLNYGFRFYETHRLYSANTALTTARVWKGAEEQLPLGLAEDLYVTIPRKEYDKLNATLNVSETITAPAAKGQQYGTVEVGLAGENIASRPLVALRDVSEGGLVGRMVDEIRLLFR